ncbi:MAG: hypothetical protein M1828_006772 [Chrysothrix sp. TS-e1954]|nr:MAG: hypothetical protein M1828_006772 [Chrysothrix sp. TS-e1954]
MRLDLKRQLFARSERVKAVDLHVRHKLYVLTAELKPTEPWLLTTLYSGKAHIWSYTTQAIIKQFELTDVPLRAGKFIARKNWICVGSDDYRIRVLNYNTNSKEADFEAHPDYIRSIAVHPTQNLILSASDDMTIKLWDWSQGFKCVRVFEGHSHYVMSVNFSPKDTNTFASACLDRTIKIWSIGSSIPNFTLEAHETKGVNYVDYYHGADKPYIVSCSDDRTIRVWDITTRALIATLEGHTSNVSFACFHPELPVIVSGSEDGTIKVWNAGTYRLEQSLNYGLERAWCVSYQRGQQSVGMGFDDGAVVLTMGREEPAVSMDNSGKIIWAKHSEISTAVIKGGDKTLVDGAPISLPSKELGTADMYPQSLVHSPNGRFVALCGDGEYVVYTALALRNQAFGSALDFAWASKENDKDFAIRESSTSVKVFRNFKEKGSGGLNVGFQAEGLSGGTLLGVKGQGGIGFFDWETGQLVRRIEVEPHSVYWSEAGELVTLACDDTFYVLRFSREAFTAALQSGEIEEDGVEAAFETEADFPETIRTGQWAGDCFIYSNTANRLQYLVGDKTYTISHSDHPLYVLGYLPRDGRVYVADKDISISSYALSLAVVEYQTLVLRGDLDSANAMLPDISADQKNKIARFLEGQNYKEQALEVATDPEHRFDLALALEKLDIALELAREADAEHKWKTVGDAALSTWDLKLAEECFTNAKDLGSLLLVHSSTSNPQGLRDLASQASAVAASNIEFSCLWQLADLDGCISCLIKTGRTAEAVLFAQTYAPSRVPKIAARWRRDLEGKSKGKVARVLAMPPGVENVPMESDGVDGAGLLAITAANVTKEIKADDEMFPEWEEWLKLEEEGKSVQESLIDVNGGAEEEKDGEAAEAKEASKGLEEIEQEAEAEADPAPVE